MKTISLEEALKRADIRGVATIRPPRINCSGPMYYKDLCSLPMRIGDDDEYHHLSEENEAIALLLAHYVNHFPKVVERLRWYMEQEEELMYYGPLAQNETQRILALAETVTLPN